MRLSERAPQAGQEIVLNDNFPTHVIRNLIAALNHFVDIAVVPRQAYLPILPR